MSGRISVFKKILKNELRFVYWHSSMGEEMKEIFNDEVRNVQTIIITLYWWSLRI